MKIRHGFVSNSSSTSFCIYGAEHDNDMWGELPRGFTAHQTEYDGDMYLVGIDLVSVFSDQKYENMTIKEIKEMVKTELEKFEIDTSNMYANCDGWHD